jgi:hypothetical protein
MSSVHEQEGGWGPPDDGRATCERNSPLIAWRAVAIFIVKAVGREKHGHKSNGERRNAQVGDNDRKPTIRADRMATEDQHHNGRQERDDEER